MRNPLLQFCPTSNVYLPDYSSHLSLGLPRLLLPCSRYYTALVGSLSSAILILNRIAHVIQLRLHYYDCVQLDINTSVESNTTILNSVFSKYQCQLQSLHDCLDNDQTHFKTNFTVHFLKKRVTAIKRIGADYPKHRPEKHDRGRTLVLSSCSSISIILFSLLIRIVLT